MSFIQSNLGSITSLYGYAFDATSQTLAAIIQQRENARLKQIKHYWNYYHGRHYDYSRVDGDLPYINMCYGMVEKSVAWLVGDSIKFKFRQDIHPIITEIAQEIMDNSGGEALWYKAAQMGGVTGDCFLQVGFEPMANYGQGGIVIKVLDSDRTFVEYTNQGNSKVLSKVMITWDEIDQNSGEVATFTEVWTPESIFVFPKNISLSIRSLSAAFKQSDIKETKDFTMYPNPYGELPFVHIPNLLLVDNVYGRSDLHDLWVMNKEMNESLVAYKDNVNYHGNPLTLLYGISLKQIEKGANKVWGNLPKDGRVENLRVESLYSDITQYMQLIEKYTGLAGPPFHLMNLEQSMWADTSQAGLRLAFMPLVELTERKKVSYGKGFKDVMEKAIKYVNTFFQMELESLNKADPRVESKLYESAIGDNLKLVEKILSLRTKPYFECEVIFADHLPRNRTMELMDLDVELRNKLESIRGAMERVGILDPAKKMEDIIQDQEWIASLDALYAASSQPPTPDSLIASEEASMSAEESIAGSQANKDAAERKAQQNSDGKEDPAATENATGQPAERAQQQVSAKGKGGI